MRSDTPGEGRIRSDTAGEYSAEVRQQEKGGQGQTEQKRTAEVGYSYRGTTEVRAQQEKGGQGQAQQE